MTVSVIDCGTNSTRLLICDDRLKAIYRGSKLTRLGENVSITRKLDQEAIKRSLEAIEEFYKLAKQHNTKALNIVATAALREVSNPEEFLEPVKNITGIKPRIISEYEEGLASFAGATIGITPDKKVVVIDIGGGSTEIIEGVTSTQNITVASLNYGCVNLFERFYKNDPPSPEQLDCASNFLNGILNVVSDRFRSRYGSFEFAIGLAGTLEVLVSVIGQIRGAANYESKLPVIRKDDLENAFFELISLSARKRQEIFKIPELRSDVVIAGAQILKEIFRAFSIEQIAVSEADLLDGFAIKMLQNKRA